MPGAAESPELGEGGLDRGDVRDLVLDALHEGVVLLDRDTGVQFANAAAMRILGCDHAELTRRWTEAAWEVRSLDGEVIPPPRQVREHPEADLDDVAGVQVIWARPDGSEVVVEIGVVPLDDPDGRRWVVTVADLTGTYVDRAIDTAEIDASPTGLAVIDGHGRFIRSNPEHTRLAGVEVVGRDARSILEPDDVAQAEADVAEAMTTGRPTPARDHRFVHPDGTVVWASATATPVRIAGRQYFVAAMTDITARRRLEERLRKFEVMFTHANDLFLVVGLDGTVRYASPSIERVLGFTPDHIAPDGILGMVHPDDVEGASAAIAEVVADGRTTSPFVTRARDHAGVLRWFECVAVNLLDDPAVGGVLVTARDITERQRLHERLRHEASHDPLTGVANRALVLEQMARSLARCGRSADVLAVCYLDLDGFKPVNDRFGHAVGDRVLAEVAGALREAVRQGDLVGRIGGDEFVVLLDPLGADDPVQVAERVVAACRRVVGEGPDALTVTASAGVVACGGDGTAEDLLHRADEALYRAKAAGRDRVVLGPPLP